MKQTLLVATLALILVGAACSRQTRKQPASTPAPQINAADTNTASGTTLAGPVPWQQSASGWQAVDTPPACPVPFTLQSPTDIAKASGILYPGQTRGGNYKPHGGFRFDTITDNAAMVQSPIDGNVVRGARYVEGGDVQYSFDIIHPCGMMIRFDHLLVIEEKFQAIVSTFPPAQENDSRTNMVEPQVLVTAGETVATKVGMTANRNTFFDFGLYDLRQKNAASKDPAYAASRGIELDQHAVCWFDYLSASDEATVRALPAGDSASGKTSDYCN